MVPHEDEIMRKLPLKILNLNKILKKLSYDGNKNSVLTITAFLFLSTVTAAEDDLEDENEVSSM